jgi:RNA polymerase sigma-70 factor (ECF subfamily)
MKDWQLAFSESKPWQLPGHAIIMEGLNGETAKTMAAEKELFWELLASLQKKLFNFLHKALNFSEDSADLYQEVVIRAWRYFPSFDQRRSFSSWLFTIAHNEIKKYFNQRKADHKVIPLELLVKEPAAPASEDPDVALIHGLARQLPLRQREVFYLFYYNGFSIAEIAAICGLRRGNVKFILNRGRVAVRKALEVTHEK